MKNSFTFKKGVLDSQWRQTGLTITSANGAGRRILRNKMYQHKDPIYYTFGAGQKNYQCHGTDGLVSLAPLAILVCSTKPLFFVSCYQPQSSLLLIFFVLLTVCKSCQLVINLALFFVPQHSTVYYVL